MFSKSFLVWALLPFIGAVPALSANESAPQAQNQASNEPIAVLPESGLPATWLQGTPVTHWEKDKVYVFEFWATWCGPCLAAIPHLDQTHREITAKKINAQIVGVNVRDRVSPAMLKPFLAKLRVPPSYTVAVDSQKNTEELWARPRKIVGIPHALAVKNGKVIWAGHPMRLSTELIEAMTQPNFGEEKQEEAPKKPDTDTLRKRLGNIASLYSSSDTEDAERELGRFLEDKTVPAALKQEALDLPCYAALAREEFQELNICLRRKAEAFPQDPANLSAVVRFILESNEIPEEEQDLELAEECLKQILSVTRDNKTAEKLRRQTLRQLARVYELGEDSEARERTLREAWQASSEYIWLKELESRLQSLPEAADAQKVYAALDKGTAALPRDFTAEAFPAKTLPQRETQAPQFKASTSAASAEMLGFLKTLNWVRGKAPESLPADGIIAVNFWAPPPPGPRTAISHRPAEWLDEKIRGHELSIPVVVIAVADNAERVRKALSDPRYASEFPVAILSRSEFLRKFGKMSDMPQLPATLILRDGAPLWQGSAQDLPTWIVENASRPDYNHEAAVKKQEAEKAVYRSKLRRLREITHSKGNKAETEKRLKEFREALKDTPALYMRASEALTKLACARKDFAEAGKVCESVMSSYPNVDYIATMQLNIVNADLQLRAANLPVIISAYRNIIGSGTPHVADYWQAISRIYAEMGDWENAVYAAFASRNNSADWKAYRAN